MGLYIYTATTELNNVQLTQNYCQNGSKKTFGKNILISGWKLK